MNTFVSCIILLLLLWINYQYVTRIYEPFPNETQFIFCNDTQGRPYYVETENKLTVPPPSKGLFTSATKVKEDLDPFHSTPLCSKSQNQENQPYFNDNKVIDYKKNTYIDPVDPWDTHASPTDDSTVIYKDKYYESQFIKYHNDIREPEIKLRKRFQIPLSPSKVQR